MSNDIQTRPATAPAVAPSQPAPRAAEVKARPTPPVETKPVVEKKPDPKETRRALEEATEHLNQQMTRNKRDLSFSVDDASNKVVVTVKNREGEVVRQIPNETVLRVAHNLSDVKGLMEDRQS